MIYMKKYLLIVSLLCVCAGLMAQGRATGRTQTRKASAKTEKVEKAPKAKKAEKAEKSEKAEEEEEVKIKGAHPYKLSQNKKIVPTYSHWSLTPHVGFNYFDGDFHNEMKHAVSIPNAGLDIEYSFTPVWGIGLNYTFDMYTVTGIPNGLNADTLLHGHMHRAGAYVSMDLINLFYSRAKKKIFSAHAIVGGGYAWWKNKAMYYDSGERPSWKRGQTVTYINEDGEFAPSYTTEYRGQLYLQAGLSLEFNLNRTLAMGLRGTYTYFTNDYMDGRGYAGPLAVASKNNDGIVDVTLFLRFKLVGVSKTHVRNMSSFETWEKPMELQQQAVHDTVIIRHDSIIVRETIEHHTATATAAMVQKEQEDIYYVYFDNNKATLDDKGLITIQQVADRLADDATLYAVITGYCDNTGSNKLNFVLGDKRAANVQDELLEEYGIAADRMYAQGLGKLVGRRSQAAYSPNRRAQIRLVDKDTFERMKANLGEERAQKESAAAASEVAPAVQQEKAAPQEKTIPLSQSARKEKVNKYKVRANTVVTTEKSTTLSKLARQYYDNTYCWVYIYAANKDKIGNPNNLVPGIKLTIPELTEKEMRITKDEGLVIFNNARNGK